MRDHALLALGIAGDRALDAAELAAIGQIAAPLLRKAGRGHPDPFGLAAVAGVPVHATGADLVILSSRAYCPRVDDQREQGLWAARALASVLLLRRDRYSDLRSWVLAAELLTPPWALGAGHPWAPEWLVHLRRRTTRRAA